MHKGKVIVKSRIMKPPCTPDCRQKCSELFTEEERLQIFEDFYASSDRNLQNQQIAALVTGEEKARTRIHNPNANVKRRERTMSKKYHLIHDGVMTPVCSTMFLNTLSVKQNRVNIVLKSVSITGAPIQDKRGVYEGRKSVADREAKVIEHIQQYKVIESHYVRKKAMCEYLPPELTVADMHRAYVVWRDSRNYPAETYEFYLRVFQERFNIKFLAPKKDKCDTCERYNNFQSEQLSNEMKADHEKHIKDKELVRKLKHVMKELASQDVEMCVAAFDLEQVLLSPYGKASSFYYSRRLINLNLTVTELNTLRTSCYLWNESDGQKGSCEVATCLTRYVDGVIAEGMKRLTLFSDRCGGQNNNRMIFVMLSHLIHTREIESISLIYFVPGHSQNENDCAHSTIERCYRNQTVYTPGQWETVITSAFKKNEVKLEVLHYSDIIDYKNPKAFPEHKAVYEDKVREMMSAEEKEKQIEHLKEINMSTRKIDKVYWSEIVMLKFEKHDPNKMFFKYSLEEMWRSTEFSLPYKPLRKAERETRECEMKKYGESLGIAPKKKEDLLKLCKSNLIPMRFHQYYENLAVNKNKKEADD